MPMRLFSTILIVCFMTMWGGLVAPAQTQGEREYVGAMGTTIRIRMKLDIRGKAIRGSYVYEAIGKPLTLTGTLTGKQVALKETDENGQHTGTFKGQFVTPTLLEGSWSNPAGSKTLPFTVKAIADSSTSSATETSAEAGISGEYRRVDANGRVQTMSGAFLNVQTQSNGAVKIYGQASLVVNAQTGNVRTGEVEGTFPISGNVVRVKGDNEYACAMTITFSKGGFEVTDDNGQCGGLAVSFNGNYKRVGPPKFD